MTGPRVSCAIRLLGALLLGVGFGLWAREFIAQTSFVAIDGETRFCLFDDAMISMRYAWNLVEGNGLVWNQGERVEGITNLLMTLYMSVLIGVFGKFYSVLAVQISGAVFLLASGVLAMRTGELVLELNGRGRTVALSLLFFAAPMIYFPLSYWTLMGMENGLLCLLSLAAVWYAVRSSGVVAFRPALPLLLSMALLTRPDAAILVGLVLVHRVAGVWGKRNWVRVAGLELGVVALFAIALCAFRLGYYGSLVPNTYTLKLTGVPLAHRLSDGLAFVKPFVKVVAPLLIVSALGVGLARNRHMTLLFALVLAAIGYQIYVGGDAWNLWRHMAGAIPLLFVLVILSLVEMARFKGFLEKALRFGAGWRYPPAGILVVLIAALGTGYLVYRVNERFEKNIVFDRPPMYVKYSKINTDQGLALKELLLPGATVGGTWAGTIPYFSEATGVDFLGKNDPHIARMEPDLSGSLKMYGMSTLPGHNKYDLDYSIKELRPTFVQVLRWGKQDLALWVFKHYRRIPYKGVPVLIRKDSPLVRWELVKKNYRPKHMRGG